MKGRTTASHDRTLETLWSVAVHESDEHFAVGLMVYIKHDALPAGWGDDIDSWREHWDSGDYDRRWRVQSVATGDNEPDTFEAGGWFWRPSDLTSA